MVGVAPPGGAGANQAVGVVGVRLDAVEPLDEALARRSGPGLVEVIHQHLGRGPTVERPLGHDGALGLLVGVEGVDELLDGGVAGVGIGIGPARAVDDVATTGAPRPRVSEMLAHALNGRHLGLDLRGDAVPVEGGADFLVGVDIDKVEDDVGAGALHRLDVGVPCCTGDVLPLTAAALVDDLEAFRLRHLFEGFGGRYRSLLAVEEERRLRGADALPEEAVHAGVVPIQAVIADLGSSPRVLAAVEREHVGIFEIPVVEREAEVGNALLVLVLRGRRRGQAVVVDEAEHVVLLDQLLGASEIGGRIHLVIAALQDQLAAMDPAMSVGVGDERLQALQGGAERLRPEEPVDAGDVADGDRRRGDTDVAVYVRAARPATARAATASATTARATAGATTAVCTTCTGCSGSTGRPRTATVRCRSVSGEDTAVGGVAHTGAARRGGAIGGAGPLLEGRVGQAGSARRGQKDDRYYHNGHRKGRPVGLRSLGSQNVRSLPRVLRSMTRASCYYVGPRSLHFTCVDCADLLVQSEDTDRVAGHDLGPLVGRNVTHGVGDDLAAVGPIVSVVRVIGRPHDVVDADGMTVFDAVAIGDETGAQVAIPVRRRWLGDRNLAPAPVPPVAVIHLLE